jgi:hypothetical protein
MEGNRSVGAGEGDGRRLRFSELSFRRGLPSERDLDYAERCGEAGVDRRG